MCMFALRNQFVDVYNYMMTLRSSDCCIVDRRRIVTRCCSGRAAQRRSWSSTATARSISPRGATPSDRRSCCVSAPTARPLSVTKPHQQCAWIQPCTRSLVWLLSLGCRLQSDKRVMKLSMTTHRASNAENTTNLNGSVHATFSSRLNNI